MIVVVDFLEFRDVPVVSIVVISWVEERDERRDLEESSCVFETWKDLDGSN